MRVLFVEAETNFGETLTAKLSRRGIMVEVTSLLATAIAALRSRDYDAIILDRTLPDIERLGFLREIGSAPTLCPVIVLSAPDSLDQRTKEYDLDAGDHLTERVSWGKALSQLRPIPHGPATGQQEQIVFGGLVFDRGNRMAEIDGIALDLSRSELLVLETLVLKAGHVVSRQSLENAVYGCCDEIASDRLVSHILRLRRKLEPGGLEILALHGISYLLRRKE